MAKPAAYSANPDNSSTRLVCPRCGHDLVRVPRHLLDRLISLVRPTQRYRCRMHECQWEGSMRVENSPTRR